MATTARTQVHVRWREQRGCWEVDARAVGCGRPTFRTAEEAHAHAAELLKQAAGGVSARDVNRDMTLREYVMRWKPGAQPDLEPRTFEGYAWLLDDHVLPALGGLRVRQLRARHVRALLKAKRAEGYAKNTVRLMRAALSTVLTDAVEEDLIDVNPCLQLGRGKKRHAGTVAPGDLQQHIRPMDWAQLAAFRAEAAKPEWRAYQALFETMALAGLRPGEALALQPGDLDFGRGLLRVVRAVSGGRIKATKTGETRALHLAAELVARLDAHLVWLAKETLRRGWGEPAWLFPSGANTPLDHNNVAKVFKRVLKHAKLPSFRIYDLRHTYASLLLSAGAPLLYVSQQMGHSSPTTTLRPHDDPPVLRKVGADRRPEVGRGAEPRSGAGRRFGTRIWNQSGIGHPRSSRKCPTLDW
jgi:integrase